MSTATHEYKKKYPILRPSIAKELVHGSTVSNLAYRIGKQMGYAEAECHNLAVAGFMHDIGKLELAKYVRGHEEETLIIEEMKYVRMHSVLGAAILEKNGYSDEIVSMVKYHHENCDGSGYPENLMRREIPMGARILRVCDSFAALTADRPYRKAFDISTALELMIEEAKNYDVQVFMALMNLVNDGEADDILGPNGLEGVLKQITEEQ